MTTINKRLKNLFSAMKKITEVYYESPEGKQYSDYEMWTLGVQSKYPSAVITPEGHCEGAYSGHTSVGYWDHQIQNGIVFDLNVIKKESIDNTTFQATDFTEDEIKEIQKIMPDAKLDLSGIVTFGKYALIKFESGVVELLQREGTEFTDFKPFKDFSDMITNLKSSIPAEVPTFENNGGFNIEGFLQNMAPYVNDINSYIEYDENQSTYFVVIPFSALKTKLEFANTPATSENKDVANKILKIAELYPRCLSSHVDWEKQEISLVFTDKNLVKESYYSKLILEFVDKDEKRIRDIVTKSNGNPMKQLQLATNMANSITDKNKAFDRGTAAVHVLGKDSEVATVFFQRARELGYPVDTELAKPAKKKVLPGSKLPFDQQYKNKYKQDNYRSRGRSVLPCGSLNLISGENKYFNVRENGDGTIEVWNSGGGKFKAVITAGTRPIHEIGERATFVHDQSPSRVLFSGVMVDYITATSMEELIPIYGKSMMCYVYK